MAYTVGDDIKVTITFTVNLTPTDPTAWSLFYKQRDASAQTELVYGVDPELTQVSTGVYEWLHSTTGTTNDDAGRWDYFVVSTGVAKAVKARLFRRR